jgi:hypothetical protein
MKRILITGAIQIPPGNDLIDRHLHVEGRCPQDHFPHE